MKVKTNRKSFIYSKQVLAMFLSISMIVSVFASTIFADAPSSWAVEDIQELEASHFVRDDLFQNYHADITRLDYAYLVYKLLESYDISLSEIADLNLDYTLTDCDDYYVMACFKAGIITGYPNRTFRPEQAITRQEICTLYMKALEIIGVVLGGDSNQLTPFHDAEEMGSWARESIIKCLDAGIINGTSSSTLEPLGFSTIEQSLVIFNRIIKNNLISDQVTPGQKDLRPSDFAYENGITYYIEKDLNGAPIGVKAYDDFDLIESIAIDDIDSGIMVFEGSLFYINLEGILIRYDLETGARMIVEPKICNGFTIGDETLYAIYDGGLYTHSLIGGVVGPAVAMDLEGDYDMISYYYNDLGSSKVYLFLVNAEGHLYRYHDEELEIVSAYMMDYAVSDNVVYVLDSEQRLKKYPLNMSGLDYIAENVQEFDVCGRNILYITTGGALYNIYRGILGSRLYQGDIRGLALDYNYLEITEGLISDTEYNHLMALFYTREYFGN